MNNIYISTFGKKVLKQKNSIPIEVGAYARTNFLYPLRDNTGDNISNKNKYYGELTGLYWVWKNKTIGKEEMIGFCHYNKCLNIKPAKADDLLINKKKYDFLVANGTYITPHPYHDELDAVVNILKKDYPKYYKTWSKVYKKDGSSEKCNNAQLFITTGKYFEAYCSFLFDVLEKVYTIIGEKNGTPYDMRYCAFMGERLLTVFLITNDLCYKEFSIKYGKRIINISRSVAAVLHLKKDSRVYKYFQQKWGNKSSYDKK